MHELSIAQALIAAVERHLPPGDFSVRRVRVAVGNGTGIVPEALELAFQAASVSTRAAGARLVIDRVPGRCRCNGCGEQFTFDGALGRCPTCATLSGPLLTGTELELCSIEVADV